MPPVKRKAVESKAVESKAAASKRTKKDESEEEDDEEKEEVETKQKEVKKKAKKPPTKSPKKAAKASKASKSKAESSGDEESASSVEESEEDQSGDVNEKQMNAALKIVCWNVNGLRAWLKKGTTLRYIQDAKPDVVCFQEVKCSKDDAPPELFKAFPKYDVQWLSGEKSGYAGVVVLSKNKPVKVTFGLGDKEHDAEGRVITAEYDKFYLVNAYVPNSGRGLPRLDYRTTKWEPAMRDHLTKLDATKPVVMCGDLNVAHREIDLANPKTNLKTAGFTPAERAEFDKLLKLGFVDSFRHFYPKKTGAYSFWSARGGAREGNIGWRLDYFVVSQRFVPNLVDSSIAGSKVLGSDHCPIILYANP